MADRLIDTSALFRPYEPGPLNRAHDKFTNVVEAMIARRAQAQQQEAEAQLMRDKMAQAQQQAAAELAFNQQKEANDQANADRTASLAQQQQKEAAQKNRLEAMKDFGGMMADPTKRGLAVPFAQAAGFRAAPAVPMPEAPQLGPEQFEETGQTPTGEPWGRMALTPADALAQRRYEEEKAKAEAAAGQWKLSLDGQDLGTVDQSLMGPGGTAAQMRPYLQQLQQQFADNPEVKRGLASMDPAVAAGMLKPETAYEQAVNNPLDRQNQLKRTLLAPRAPHIDREAENRTDNAARDWANYLGQQTYKADSSSINQFNKMIEQGKLAAQGNSAAAKVFMGQFTKYAQGEVGVLTPGDMKVFYGDVGTPMDKAADFWANLTSGTMDEGKRRQLAAAIENLQNTVKKKLDVTYRNGVDLMRKWGPDGERWVKATFGRGFPENEAEKDVAEMRAARGAGRGPTPPGAIPRSLRR